MRVREGKIILRPIHNLKKTTLQDEILYVIEEGSTIYTDELMRYRGLNETYIHAICHHSCHGISLAVMVLIRGTGKSIYLHASGRTHTTTGLTSRTRGNLGQNPVFVSS